MFVLYETIEVYLEKKSCMNGVMFKVIKNYAFLNFQC